MRPFTVVTRRSGQRQAFSQYSGCSQVLFQPRRWISSLTLDQLERYGAMPNRGFGSIW
jgi:hypothetical protein